MLELEDQNWFPTVLRNFQTEFIGYVVSRFQFYRAFILYLNQLNLVKKPLTDLCSGSGEPAISIFKQSKCFSNLLLTDKFPGTLFSNDAVIQYETQPVDALQLKFEKDTYYTMFNAFHHFTDVEKKELIGKIQQSGASAFFAEVLEPTLFCVLKVFLMATVGCLILTPFIRPFSFKRLLFTYIIPVNIAGILFDGIVSVYKSRSEKQYRSLFSHMNQTVSIHRFTGGISPVILIHIHPAA